MGPSQTVNCSLSLWSRRLANTEDRHIITASEQQHRDWVKLGCEGIETLFLTHTHTQKALGVIHISHKSRIMKSLGPGPRCGAVGMLGGSEVIVKKRSWNFRGPDTGVPQIYEAYCLCMSTASLCRAKTKRSGLCVANYCTRPDMRARDAGREGESVWSGVYVRHNLLSSPPHGARMPAFLSVNTTHD